MRLPRRSFHDVWAAGQYDFVVGHYYSFPNIQRSSFEDVVLTGNYQILDEILQTDALLRLYIWGMMHRAVRLIHYLREDLLRGASSWEMFPSAPTLSIAPKRRKRSDKNRRTV